MRTSWTSRLSFATGIDAALARRAPVPEAAFDKLNGLLGTVESRRLRAAERNGCVFVSASLPGRARAAFTTRIGGVSEAPYSSLNLSAKTGDDQGHVAQNRARAAAALGCPQTFVVPNQVHGTRVVGAAEYLRDAEHIGEAERAPVGEGARPAEADRPPADGLVLHAGLDAGLASLLLFADCLPVVLVGEVDMSVVHAGWRGLLDGVLQQAARSMTGPPALALLGPSIGPCCYEVGPEVRESFISRYGRAVVAQGRLDMWRAAERALEDVGVGHARVVNPRLCTNCNPDLFYSHRRDGAITGRQGAVAWYEPEGASMDGGDGP